MKFLWRLFSIIICLAVIFSGCAHQIILNTNLADGRIYVDGEYKGTGTADVVVGPSVSGDHHLHVNIEQEKHVVYSTVLRPKLDIVAGLLNFFGYAGLAAISFYSVATAEPNPLSSSPEFYIFQRVGSLIVGSGNMVLAGLSLGSSFQYKDSYYFEVE